jgi:DNA mismatch repair protein MutS2
MESINVKIKQVKVSGTVYDSNKKTIYIGQKVEDIAENTLTIKTKKSCLVNFENIRNREFKT